MGRRLSEGRMRRCRERENPLSIVVHYWEVEMGQWLEPDFTLIKPPL